MSTEVWWWGQRFSIEIFNVNPELLSVDWSWTQLASCTVLGNKPAVPWGFLGNTFDCFLMPLYAVMQQYNYCIAGWKTLMSNCKVTSSLHEVSTMIVSTVQVTNGARCVVNLIFHAWKPVTSTFSTAFLLPPSLMLPVTWRFLAIWEDSLIQKNNQV